MRRYAIEDSRSETIRKACAQAWPHTWPVGARDRAAASSAVHQWIRSHVKYVEGATLVPWRKKEDAAEDQVLIRPVDLLAMTDPQGDCAVFSMLAAAMLARIGIPHLAYKTVKADPEYPDQYSHVYVIADGLPIDASHGPRAGWEVTQYQPIAGAALWPLEKQMIIPLAELDYSLSDSELSSLAQDINPTLAPGVLSQMSIPPPMISTSPTSGWLSVLNTGINDAAKILGTRYAVPQYAGSLSPGMSVRNANGTITQAAPGMAISSGGGSSLLLIGGIGLAALLAIATMGRKN